MDLVSESMVPAMDEAGRLFEAKEYFGSMYFTQGKQIENK